MDKKLSLDDGAVVFHHIENTNMLVITVDEYPDTEPASSHTLLISESALVLRNWLNGLLRDLQTPEGGACDEK